MSSTITIPLSTMQPNQVFTSPDRPLNGATDVVFVLDRNVGNFSLDSQTNAHLVIEVDESFDGGQTFTLASSGTVPGGPLSFVDKQGILHTVEQSTIETNFSPGATDARAVVTNGPVKVSISGTVTLNP